MRTGELCAGYGGLGMAVEEVFGAESAWFSEFDAAPSKILAHHWPDVPNYGDMTTIDWANIEHVDIISGGTPCQDLSAAGSRRGMTEGTRSNLWVNMREAIAVLRPEWVVWENVRGAYSAEASSDLEFCPGCMGDATDRGTVLRALGRVLGDLSDLGYDAEWRGLRAADVGACHARYRVFVLAKNTHISTRDERRLTASGEAEGGRSWPDAGRGRAYAADASSERCVQVTSLQITVDHLLPTCTVQDGANTGGPSQFHRNTLPLNTEVLILPHLDPKTPVEEYENLWYSLADRSAYWITEERPGIPSVDYGPAIARWELVMGRVSPPPSIPDGRGGKFRLNPAFTEWMMGMPDGWITSTAIGISRNEQLKACGNGVVPQQAMAALRDMLAAFQTAEVEA